MYKKHAERIIIKDVQKRLKDQRDTLPYAYWATALSASQEARPDLYKHFPRSPHVWRDLERLLADGGIDMSVPENLPGFVGNMQS